MSTESGVRAREQVQQQQSEPAEPIDLEQNYHAIGISALNAATMFTHRGPKPVQNPGMIFEFED